MWLTAWLKASELAAHSPAVMAASWACCKAGPTAAMTRMGVLLWCKLSKKSLRSGEEVVSGARDLSSHHETKR